MALAPETLNHDLVKTLNQYLQNEVRFPRIRIGEQQEIETLINEEVLLFAEYLRNETKDWIPRIGATAKKVKEKCTEH